MDFKINDSVKVKSGVKDPDLKINIAGWQGRIVEISAEDDLVLIAWDSVTLKAMPGWVIDRCEEEGLDWGQMSLSAADIELTKPRDRLKEVEKISDSLEASHIWNALGAEGKRINAVLAGIDPENYEEAYEAWEKHLHLVLVFPFDAHVSESQDRGPIHDGDKVKVHALTAIDDLAGIIVEVRFGREKFYLPLCDLTPVDKKSPNYQPVHDYAVWFANK